jgi:putative serine protease PepD
MTEENSNTAGQPEQPSAPQAHTDGANRPVEQQAHPVSQPTEPVAPYAPVAQPMPPTQPMPVAHQVQQPTQPMPVAHQVQQSPTPYPQPVASYPPAQQAPYPYPQPAPAAPPHNPFALPGGQQQHAPGSFGPFGVPSTDGSAAAADSALAGAGGAPASPTTARQRRFWMPLIGTAAATALVASLATAGLVGAFDHSSSTSPASIASIGQTSTQTVPVAGSTSSNPDWQKVSKAVSASVVAIKVTTQQGEAEGSGIILDTKGHILTNNHVVSGAQNNTVSVTLTDGRIYSATVVGTDPTTDLAVILLKNPPSDLSPAALGDSSTVVVGDPVMAVGNPLGLANTATTGIVSAIDRPVSASESGSPQSAVVTNAIQIDAAINPGNSGGPLFDAQGRVIGITSSIATLSQTSGQSGSIGLGFAIPVNLAKNIASQLIDTGSAKHAFLGVNLQDGTATADGVTRQGAVIKDVVAGSPAANAGLQVNDVVVAIDGKAVAGAESLTGYVRAMSAGQQADLTIVRGGKALDVKATLAVKKDTPTTSSNQNGGSSNQNGSTQQGGQGGFFDPFGFFGQG